MLQIPVALHWLLMDFELFITQGQRFTVLLIQIINDDAFELTEACSASLSLISSQNQDITVAPDTASIFITALTEPKGLCTSLCFVFFLFVFCVYMHVCMYHYK